MNITIPKLSLVVLIGPSGAGKSTFARKHFRATEILSSDACRGLVSDDENDQNATNDAFAVLHFIAAKRLALGKLTVIDATNVQPESRKPLIELARQYHCIPVAVILDMPERICQDRNRARPDRTFGPHVIGHQRTQLRRGLKGLSREGFRHVFHLRTLDEVESAIVERVPLYNDKTSETGPFDIIGDVHGCCDELEVLLAKLGYIESQIEENAIWGSRVFTHPEGRRAVFVGDLVDRGPRSLDTVRLVRNMLTKGSALCVPGNHDMKVYKHLRGKKVQVKHGLAETLAEFDALPEVIRPKFQLQLADFLDALVSHYVLDGGKLVVAHAGMKQELQGRGSATVRAFALYGETTGETDEFGLPVRYNWAAEYRGSAMVVYGHTPVPKPEWLNRTVNIDTGCVFGGKLTALRYPEREFVSVDAARVYCEPVRPFIQNDIQSSTRTSQQIHDDILDADDVLGKRLISTRLRSTVIIREENATAALEVMSRFAANPRWLIYLPPTMSPCETTREPGLLEHPAEAFEYYRSQGAARVICEEKHMGSRAIVVVCKDTTVARDRFGVTEDEAGIVYTRTGRRFFTDIEMERQVIERLRAALDATEFWSAHETTWACLDCELMPWSAKAQELLRLQYAAVGAAGSVALPRATTALAQAVLRLECAEKGKVEELLGRSRTHDQSVTDFITAYRRYCWSVNSLDDLKLAPFHVLATEGKVHVDKDHTWHMQTLAKVCAADEKLLNATAYKLIDLNDANSVAEGTTWWMALTASGGEGMVVKPVDFVLPGKRGLAQPAVKCRGREYLRIIYGPEYTTEANLSRLRNRNLGHKRSLALGEFALGVEALERFVRSEPLRRVHECVFGVLALESEPVDPRL